MDNFRLLKSFIPKESAEALSAAFVRDLAEAGITTGDEDCPNSPTAHNYLPFVALLSELTLRVKEEVGETVLPSYCYARSYKEGESLKEHTDRDSCEISLSLNLSSDTPWPLYIRDPEKGPTPIYIEPGDALIYKGVEIPHWREPFTGQSCVQVFLHYVRMDGPHRFFYFDK